MNTLRMKWHCSHQLHLCRLWQSGHLCGRLQVLVPPSYFFSVGPGLTGKHVKKQRPPHMYQGNRLDDWFWRDLLLLWRQPGVSGLSYDKLWWIKNKPASVSWLLNLRLIYAPFMYKNRSVVLNNIIVSALMLPCIPYDGMDVMQYIQ